VYGEFEVIFLKPKEAADERNGIYIHNICFLLTCYYEK